MRSSSSCLLVSSITLVAAATNTVQFALPQNSSNKTARALAILDTRDGFLYGPALGASGPFYPAGPLGNATVEADYASLEADSAIAIAAVTADVASVEAAINIAGGIKSLSDYSKLYTGEFTHSMPGGAVDSGMLTNYTEDLLFSMERLTGSPFSISRLSLSAALPFALDATIAPALTGLSLGALHAAGRLFYANHSSQSTLTLVEGRYAAACEAYFYIDSKSGDFLPLAIKANRGNNLIYSPLDTANDWLLAKMMFNSNDMWYSAWFHLANQHYIPEIAYQAAIHTLSAQHPVLVILKRLLFQGFSMRLQAKSTLFAAGAFVDKNFAFGGPVAAVYTDELYRTAAGYATPAGSFTKSYFLTDLKNRGLIDSSEGPPLKHFPFFEDGIVIYTALELFMTTFVESYYPTTASISQDYELQNWILEAGPAEIIDFPAAPIKTQATLIEMLTHVAYLVTIAHHTLNANNPIVNTAVVPFHSAALYAPIPTIKGNTTSLLPWTPPAAQAISQIFLFGVFARPEMVGTNRSLIHMFDDADVLGGMNVATNIAAALFKGTMTAFSKVVAARHFDANGFCNGLPFIWKTLDPNVAPFSLTV